MYFAYLIIINGKAEQNCGEWLFGGSDAADARFLDLPFLADTVDHTHTMKSTNV